MINIQWYARRFLRPKIFDVRSYYSSVKHTDNFSSNIKRNIRFFSSYGRFYKRKISGNLNFRKNNRYVLFSGILTWLGLKKEEEDPMISVIKLGVLSMQKEEFDKAENILHLALKLAQERQDMQAQRYIFDLLANVAFKKGDFPKAEKLFIQVTKELIASGTPPDDNAIVEISLKLASIYGQTNERQKAEIGFKFCIDTQQAKITEINVTDADADALSEYQKDTVLLWAMSVDWYARYLLAHGKLKEAIENFQKAFEVSEKVNGTSHPQTLVLLNDIGSVHSLMKQYEFAIDIFKKAIERSSTDSPDIPAFYCNLGATYLQAGNVNKGEEACKTALKLAKNLNNEEALADANECLAEVKGLKS